MCVPIQKLNQSCKNMQLLILLLAKHANIINSISLCLYRDTLCIDQNLDTVNDMALARNVLLIRAEKWRMIHTYLKVDSDPGPFPHGCRFKAQLFGQRKVKWVHRLIRNA